MKIYNELSGLEKGSDAFSELVLTRVFHIFTEILQEESLMTKISTLRDCACARRKPVSLRLHPSGHKQL